MRLSVITDELSQDLEYALSAMAEYDVRGAELRGLWGTNIADIGPAHVKRARAALAARDAVVTCLATPIMKCDLDSASRSVSGQMHLASARTMDEQADVLKRCLDLAGQFETPYIRVFSFWRKGEMTADVEARIVEALASLGEIAGRSGVTLLLENEYACYVGTGVEAARVVASVNSPYVQGCWDPGNALCAGELPYPVGYEAIRSCARHIHIKDGVVEQGGASVRWTVVGDGDIDYIGHIAALRRDGYDGYLSLETHYIPRDGTPEDGSRPCLAALRKLVEE